MTIAQPNSTFIVELPQVPYNHRMNQALYPSKQKRSSKTQDRILRATARLLENNQFEAISVRKIIDEADTSTGSFYARFRDKDALLSVLYDEYEIDLEKRLKRLKHALCDAKSLETVVELMVGHFVKTFGEIPNLSRAVFEYSTRAPDSIEAEEHSAGRRKQYYFLIDALLEYQNEFSHSNPVRASELSLYFMVVACRNRLMYPLLPQTRILKISKKELKTELAKLMIGYLRN